MSQIENGIDGSNTTLDDVDWFASNATAESAAVFAFGVSRLKTKREAMRARTLTWYASVSDYLIDASEDGLQRLQTEARGHARAQLGEERWYNDDAVFAASQSGKVLAVSAKLNIPGTVTITIASPGVVSWTAHGLPAGARIKFYTTGALPTGLVAGTEYYVVSPTTDAFSVAATWGGAAIVTTGSQSGVHTGYPLGAIGIGSQIYGPSTTVTMTIASPAVVSWTAHGLTSGCKVKFTTTGALPTGLSVDTTYYVKSPTTDAFNLSATADDYGNPGAVIDTTGSQSGVHSARVHGVAIGRLSASDGVGNWLVDYSATISSAAFASYGNYLDYFKIGDGVPYTYEKADGSPNTINANNLVDASEDAFSYVIAIQEAWDVLYDALVAAYGTVGTDQNKIDAMKIVIDSFDDTANWPDTALPL